MYRYIVPLLLLGATALGAAEAPRLWLTTPDKSSQLSNRSDRLVIEREVDPEIPAIVVTEKTKFQSIDGFGFALTGGSAQHIIQMSPDKRHELLRELFSHDADAISLSYLRVSIGASDLNERVFSYDDIPEGQTDEPLAHFSLSDDRGNVVPVLKEILAINPKIKILGSPWSAPTWMKTNGKVQGGKLKTKYYSVYARYFAKYIKAMASQGITIDAITVQNEPFNDGNTPSMQMFAGEQAEFIRDHLGPVFRKERIKTKILIYDHNCDAPEFPMAVLSDAKSNPFVDGSAFHLYAGKTSAMSRVHESFPEKNIYFTEIMAVDRDGTYNIAGPVSRILIGATRNWSRNVLIWNLAADAQFRPHTDNGGCGMCEGAVTIEGDKVTRNLAYYVIAHASKFVPDGSIRISSTSTDELPNVAFRTPEGKTVLIAANPSAADEDFQIIGAGTLVRTSLPKGAVATFVW